MKTVPGIIASVTSALYKGGCNLGEASMLRLGGLGLFTIMAMVSGAKDNDELNEIECDGFEARAVLHKIDHLDRILSARELFGCKVYK